MDNYGPRGQTMSIDGSCTARLQQARTPFDPYPRQHGGRQRMRAVSCCTLAPEAEHRFVSPSKRRVLFVQPTARQFGKPL